MGQKLKWKCVLCESEKLKVIEINEPKSQQTYFQCAECDLIFLSPHLRLSFEYEKKRYELHENDVLDFGYQSFVSSLKNEILHRFDKSSKGLDYGSGKNSAVSFLLEQSGYYIERFDPFFNKNQQILALKSYDYIVVCEVAEHFYEPRIEIEKLKTLLKPKGFLFLLTSLKTDEIDFKSWSYRRDPTHVCFYSERTFQWIEGQFDLTVLKIEMPNLIVLQKKDNI